MAWTICGQPIADARKVTTHAIQIRSPPTEAPHAEFRPKADNPDSWTRSSGAIALEDIRSRLPRVRAGPAK